MYNTTLFDWWIGLNQDTDHWWSPHHFGLLNLWIYSRILAISLSLVTNKSCLQYLVQTLSPKAYVRYRIGCLGNIALFNLFSDRGFRLIGSNILLHFFLQYFHGPLLCNPAIYVSTGKERWPFSRIWLFSRQLIVIKCLNYEFK